MEDGVDVVLLGGGHDRVLLVCDVELLIVMYVWIEDGFGFDTLETRLYF